MFQRILCPIDFDGNSMEAVRLARRLALRDEATLYLVHVVTLTDPLMISAPRIAQIQESESRELLRRIAEGQLTGVPHTTLLRHGNPAAEVIKAANEVKADLIVAGTHARQGLSHLVLGSVAEKIVREAPCPVMTVRMSGAGQKAAASAA